jgi:hypothetical protein
MEIENILTEVFDDCFFANVLIIIFIVTYTLKMEIQKLVISNVV